MCRKTGDLIAALLLAWTYRYPDDLCGAVERAIAGLQAVLAATAREAGPAVQATERTSEVRALPCQPLRLAHDMIPYVLVARGSLEGTRQLTPHSQQIELCVPVCRCALRGSCGS